MLARIIAGVWLVGFLTCIGYDIVSDSPPPTYTSYQVVSKAQEYSYHKSSATQVNILIVKNLETGKLENKNVTVETHFTSDVGDTLQFENDDRHLWKSFWYFVFSLIFVMAAYLLVCAGIGVRWIFTGKTF
jgi:hypothetical protein